LHVSGSLLDAMSRASAYQVEERLMAAAQLRIETYNDDRLRCHEVDAPDCEVMLMRTGQAVRGLENLRAGEKAHKAMPLRPVGARVGGRQHRSAAPHRDGAGVIAAGNAAVPAGKGDST
jgi:hypothetical protein